MLKGGGVTRVWKCQRRAEGRRVTCDENDEVFTAKLPVGAMGVRAGGCDLEGSGA